MSDTITAQPGFITEREPQVGNFWNRLNPRRVIQAVDGLPQLQKLVRDMHEGQKTMQRELRAVGRRLDSMSAQLASQQKLLDEFPELRARVRQLGSSRKIQTGSHQRIKESWPDLPNDGQDLRFTVLNSRLLLRLPGFEIKPHRDPRWAFVTCLIYLPKPTDATVYGTHLYRLVHEREAPSGSPFWLEYADCELVKSVPGSARSALAFVNWSGAHSASMPGDAPAGTHRYLYQLQIGPDSASRERIMTHVAADRRSAWASREDY